MNILVVGSGGREHALVWKLKQSPGVNKIFVAPGNAGTASLATNVDLSKTEEIVAWLKENSMDLVVVGPDNYLEEGLVDTLNNLNIPVFGPTKRAAEIEWSKAFAKRFMKEEGIPTSAYEIFRDITLAKKYVHTQSFPLVIKASGLALGKGVIVVQDIKEAEKALDLLMKQKAFGKAGDEVIIEEYLQGQEFSVHAFCDGENFILFPPSQDHKKIYEGDLGPNTGGMGTLCPVPSVTEKHMQEIEEKIVQPTLTALKKRGRTFKGILFPGIMMTSNGPKVIEFNARFGDPETQVYMRLLDSDLLTILLACVDGDLKEKKVKWLNKSACCVVCASRGYPGVYEVGKVIRGLDLISNEDTIIFHAGTKMIDGSVVTNGGRVLGVSSVGNDLREALRKSYASIDPISFDGMYYRKDIGNKSL